MRRAVLIGVAAGAAALVIGGAVVWWLVARPPTAEESAMRYLDALAAGDFATIDEMRSEPLEPAAETVLEQAFAGASEYVQNPRIDRLVAEDATTTVHATVELAGEQHALTFDLSAEGGRWLLAGDYLGDMTVSIPLGDSVWVGDALAPVAAPILLLPAVYPVVAAPRALLAGEESAIVADGPSEVAMDVTLTSAATDRAQEQLEAYADACAEPATAVPAHCGLKVPWAADLALLSGLTFRIETRPTVRLSPDGTTFAATDGVIVATADGSTRTGAPGSFTYRADDWALRGTIAFTGDEMVLAVD